MSKKIGKGLLIVSFFMILGACGKTGTYDSVMSKADEAITAKKFDEAQKEVKEALKIKPDDLKAKDYEKQLNLYSDALANVKNKKYDQAQQDLDKIIKIKEGSSKLISYAKQEQRQITIQLAKEKDSKVTKETSQSVEKKVKLTASIEQVKDSSEVEVSEEKEKTTTSQSEEKQVDLVENNKLLAAKVAIKQMNITESNIDSVMQNLMDLTIEGKESMEIWSTGVFIEKPVTLIVASPLAGGMIVYHNNGDGTVMTYPVPTHFQDKAWDDAERGPELANNIISNAKMVDISDVSDELAQRLADFMTGDV